MDDNGTMGGITMGNNFYCFGYKFLIEGMSIHKQIFIDS